MNIKSNMQSSRCVSRAYTTGFAILLLILMAGCVQPILSTPTNAPTVTAAWTLAPTATLTPSQTLSPSPTLTATDTATYTPSPSPTITATPAPSWTPWFVGMNYPQTERLVIDPKNPHQNCMITYFDLTLAPGHIGVWRRDNGNYLICEALIKP